MISLNASNENKDNSYLRNLCVVYFFYIILEGAFRKWFIPSLSIEVLLIRDLFVIFIITQGILKKSYNFNSILEKSLIYWTFLVLIWLVMQLNLKDNVIGVFFFGFRFWVLYFWLSVLIFRIYQNFDEIDDFFIKIVYTIFPISILVLIQHYLPIDHIINTQVGGGTIFTVANNIVRVTGPFSFTAGFGEYVSFITPFFLYFILERKKKASFLIKTIFIFSFASCIIVSGSRTIILTSFVMILISLILNKKSKNYIANFFILFIILFLCYLIFERAIDASIVRFESVNESFIFRIYDTILPEAKTWEGYTTLGRGIGLGSNMSSYFTTNYFFLGEHEVDKIINEGGLLGIFFYVFKIIMSFYFIMRSKKIYKQHETALPLYFSLYLANILLLHQITTQVTVHAFAFLAIGFMILLINIYPKDN